MTCCFFGHKEAPPSIQEKLVEAIERLMWQGVCSFLVGNQGQFDAMVLSVLRNMKRKYPQIEYSVVLAYMPAMREEFPLYKYGETFLPEGIESVHPKYVISWRNKWMVDRSEYATCYVTHSWGGAAKYVEIAGKKGKQVIKLDGTD